MTAYESAMRSLIILACLISELTQKPEVVRYMGPFSHMDLHNFLAKHWNGA